MTKKKQEIQIPLGKPEDIPLATPPAGAMPDAAASEEKAKASESLEDGTENMLPQNKDDNKKKAAPGSLYEFWKWLTEVGCKEISNDIKDLSTGLYNAFVNPVFAAAGSAAGMAYDKVGSGLGALKDGIIEFLRDSNPDDLQGPKGEPDPDKVEAAADEAMKKFQDTVNQAIANQSMELNPAAEPGAASEAVVVANTKPAVADVVVPDAENQLTNRGG